MTEQVKNLFKHKIPFHSRKNSIEKRGMGMNDISLYRSVQITFLPAIDIYDSEDIFNKAKPFLDYLVSKHITTKHEGYTYFNSFFRIGITYDSGEDNHREYEKLITVEVEQPETTTHDDVFIFGEPKFEKFNPYKIYSNSIEIDIDACGCYLEEDESEVEMEDESEDEEEEIENESEEDTTPVAISKPFHSDQCVVCLSKKPELLFVNCLHRCVCIECEETNPFRRCPSCRTHISIKVKI